MTPLEKAARKYAEELWRHGVLETEQTQSDLDYALERLREACEDTYPMPRSME
jgi:hypothetical protein